MQQQIKRWEKEKDTNAKTNVIERKGNKINAKRIKKDTLERAA